MRKLSKHTIATMVALFFHTIGLVGILCIDQKWFSDLTGYNLLLSFVLLLWTQSEKNIPFFLFLIAAFVIGFAAELIGVNTALLFGEYQYGSNLGMKWHGVPWVIGINWFIIVYCSGVTITTLLRKIVERNGDAAGSPSTIIKTLSVVVDGATLAVLFDWIMEPVAIKLGYWKWLSADIPLFNYFSWFLVSAVLLIIFRALHFNKHNKFAIHLFLIQMMFFLLLRTFL